MNHWDPQQYHRFGRERARPFLDLISHIPDNLRVHTAADLGCGAGTLTHNLCTRWPKATVYGVDSSPQMLEKACRLPAHPRLQFVQADIADWRPPRQLDCIVSNAALHWIPDHARVVPHLLSLLAPRGVLAVQMPRNFDQPAHRMLYELVSQNPWAGLLNPKGKEHQESPSPPQERPSVETPDWYAQTLRRAGLQVEVWETIYHHLLGGQDAVLEWMKGTALRPFLSQLPEQIHGAFLADYGERLATAYPPSAHGTPFPFRRLFFIAQRN